MTDQQTLLDHLYSLYADCSSSPLYIQGAQRLVPGDGNASSPIVFIGEAPGREEDEQGRPFVGRSGKLLTLALAHAGVERKEVFITNIVKYRPPSNRTPTLEEAQLGKKLILQHELDIIRPKLIVTLGLCALQGLLEETMSMSRVRGSLLRFYSIHVFPTYHPAYILRNPSAKDIFFSDIKKAIQLARK